MTLKHCYVEEKYKAAMGAVGATVTNKIDYYYHPNEYIKIPSLDEQVSYTVEGNND